MNAGAEVQLGMDVEPVQLPPGGFSMRLAAGQRPAEGPMLDAFRWTARLRRRLRFAFRPRVVPWCESWGYLYRSAWALKHAEETSARTTGGP